MELIYVATTAITGDNDRLKIAFESLGMFYDGDNKRQIIGSENILGLFDEDKPSMDELEKSFKAFDTNKEGYIDAKELQFALSEMG
ncbi:EF-hand domain pair [Artemisia annua]|uniref:EF-hand domain pair n=1 Tax=Artemisia annua TaxID=35608 RepID=A0A2U1LHH8_ARTAN|nr:EF-hand domain pair [Artemisia annua]